MNSEFKRRDLESTYLLDDLREGTQISIITTIKILVTFYILFLFKTRYDIVEHEKKRTVTDHTMIMADYGSLQEELMKCREEMNEVSFDCFFSDEKISTRKFLNSYHALPILV